jgi:hypothetical protein
MALEYMHDELVKQLESYGATDAQIDTWREQWRAAVESAGDPLPCPKCFYQGLPTGRLRPMKAEPKRARSRCASCGAYFDYLDED